MSRNDRFKLIEEWSNCHDDPATSYTEKESELLKLANYINNDSLGTIDIFSVLRKTYEQGVEDGIKSL